MEITINVENWDKLMRELLECTGFEEMEDNQTHNIFETATAWAVTKTVYKINREIFYNDSYAIEKLVECLPDNFHLTCIPPTLFDKEMPHWFLTSDFPSFAEWVKNLPEESVKEHNNALKIRYFYLARMISQIMRRKKNGEIWKIDTGPLPAIREGDWCSTGYLAIIDEGKEYDANKVNWHGQNLSQVVFNCGIHYDSRSGLVSIHT